MQTIETLDETTLDKETFVRGIQLLNSVIPDDRGIQTDDSWETYWLILNDLDSETYLKAIFKILKEKVNMYSPPSPGEIIKVYKELFATKINVDTLMLYVERDILLNDLTSGEMPNYTPLLKEAINTLGGWSYVSSLSELTPLKEMYVKIATENMDRLNLPNKQKVLI